MFTYNERVLQKVIDNPIDGDKRLDWKIYCLMSIPGYAAQIDELKNQLITTKSKAKIQKIKEEIDSLYLDKVTLISRLVDENFDFGKLSIKEVLKPFKGLHPQINEKNTQKNIKENI